MLINSLFGFYGTSGVGFNDMEAAALVTAYGRRILRFMIDVIEKAGGIQVESDTDGVFFSHSEPLLIFEKLQNALPTGINIELEILWHEDGKITTKGSCFPLFLSSVNTTFDNFPFSLICHREQLGLLSCRS